MSKTLATVHVLFTDGSFVKWHYLGKATRLYKKVKKYGAQVRVENGPNSIDQYFETWDKPSEHTALHFIKNAIKI